VRYDVGEGFAGVELNEILAPATPGSAMFADLSFLFLEDITMSTPGTVFAHLNMQKLKDLTLINCEDAHLFLDELSKYFSNNSGMLSAIRIVHLLSAEDGDIETMIAIENLLKVSPELHSIELALNNFQVLSKDSILPHKETLYSLMVDTREYDIPRYYKPEDLKEIVQACQKLQYIAIDMPPVKLGKKSEMADKFSLNALSPHSRFEEVLVSSLNHLAILMY
jgi:hypothetical protein